MPIPPGGTRSAWRRVRRRVWHSSVPALLMLVAAAPAAAQDLVLQPADGATVEAVINGVPLRLKVEFDLLPGITLNPDAAARAGLARAGGWNERIGPIQLEGSRTEAYLLLAGAVARTDIRWRDLPAAIGADGAVSVHSLPFDSVTVNRAEARPGEREVSYPTRLHGNHGIHHRLKVGRRRIAVRFSLSRPRTTAPAAAAALVAAQQGGRVGNERGFETIVPGVDRPVRTLRLDRPLAIGPLPVAAMMVRTSDWRGSHELAWEEQVSESGEILVTGARDSQEALYRITLGLDVLGHCSAATYRRHTGEISLRCGQD